MKVYNYFAASDYGCNAYGSGAYNANTCASQSGGSSNPLANTGYDILIPLCLGAAVIIASAIWLVRRLVRNHQPKLDA